MSESERMDLLEDLVIHGLTGRAPDFACAYCGAKGRPVDGSDGGPAGVHTDHEVTCIGLAAIAPTGGDDGQ